MYIYTVARLKFADFHFDTCVFYGVLKKIKIMQTLCICIDIFLYRKSLNKNRQDFLGICKYVWIYIYIFLKYLLMEKSELDEKIPINDKGI